MQKKGEVVVNNEINNNYANNYILKKIKPKTIKKSYLDSYRTIIINRNKLVFINTTINELDKSVINEIINLLHNIGMRDNLLGYHCYIEGLLYSLTTNRTDRKYMYNVYENGERTFNKKISTIERNMRYAKDTSWKYNSISYIEKILGYPFNYKNEIPTNMELLLILVECLKIIIDL